LRNKILTKNLNNNIIFANMGFFGFPLEIEKNNGKLMNKNILIISTINHKPQKIGAENHDL